MSTRAIPHPSHANSAAAPGAGRPIRVCFVIDDLAAAGTELQLLRLIEGLDRGRFQPHLCLLRGGDSSAAASIPADCPVVRLGVRSLHRPTALAAAWRFAGWLRFQRIDIVQTHFPDSTYFGALVARAAGVRCVLRTRRDLGYWLRGVDRVLGRIYNRLTTGVVANCEACRRAIIAQERTPRAATVVIENGIDLAPFAAIPAPAPDGNGHCRTVGMVANLRPVKAPDVFVRAAAIVARRSPGVVFQIAGGGDLDGVRRLADECGLGNRLRLRGAVTDIPAFLGRLNVAVLTSHSEGLSNALLEYMAAARPIVATAVGGNVELIENGVHGLLVPAANPEAVASAIERLLADHALAAALGGAARQRVAEHYSPAAMVERYEQLYTRLMEPKNVRPRAIAGRKRTPRTSETHAHSGTS